MTSPCSSLTPIRCSLLYLSLHPQNSSCQFMSYSRHWDQHPRSHPILSSYCSTVLASQLRARSLLPSPFHIFSLCLFLSLSRRLQISFQRNQPPLTAAAAVPCLAGPNPNASALVGAKSHGLLLSPGPRQEKPNQYQQALPLQTQRDDVLEHVCECLSVSVCVFVCERERERSRLGTQGVWIQLRHKSQSCQHTVFSGRRCSINRSPVWQKLTGSNKLTAS